MLDKQGRTPEEAAKFWHDAYWDVMFNRSYAPAAQYTLLRETDNLRALNQKQAGMLMERDLTIRQLKEQLMKEQTAEVLPFRLGNSSEPPIDKDWLSKMDSGTRFLAKLRASNGYTLDDFVIASDPKKMDYVFLGMNLNQREGCFKWVDPQKFSQAYELCMTLEVIEMQDGNSDNVQTGRVASDAEPEVVDGLHEKE